MDLCVKTSRGDPGRTVHVSDRITRDGLYDAVAREFSLSRDRLKLVSLSEGQSIQNETHVRALSTGSEVLALVVGPVPAARHPGGSGSLVAASPGSGFDALFGSRGGFGGRSAGRVGRAADGAPRAGLGDGPPEETGELHVGSLEGLGAATEAALAGGGGAGGGGGGESRGAAAGGGGASAAGLARRLGAAPGATRASSSWARPASGAAALSPGGRGAGSNIHGLSSAGSSSAGGFGLGFGRARGSASSAAPASSSEAGTSFGDWDDPLRLRLPSNAPAWKRRSAAWLLAHGVPEAAIVTLFAIAKPRAWAIVLAWYAGARVATAHDLGPIYMLATAGLLVWRNLGERRPGQASAYSIFNGGRRLPGQLTAGDIDRQFTHRHTRDG